MSYISSSDQSIASVFVSQWNSVLRMAAPVFVRLLPAYLVITVCASLFSVAILLVLGKAAFHLTCMFSPLIFILIGLSIDNVARCEPRSVLPASWYPVCSRFWRYAAPLALAIGLCLNVVVLIAMVLGDLGAWRAGALPNLNFPADLFAAEKLSLLLILLTTSTEQQLIFMPFLVVLGGRLEPHLVAQVIARRCSLEEARELQAGLSKRDKLIYAPMRLLVLVGVGLQFMAKDISGTHAYLGTAMLMASYFGWLLYACMLASIAQMSAPELPQAAK